MYFITSILLQREKKTIAAWVVLLSKLKGELIIDIYCLGVMKS